MSPPFSLPVWMVLYVGCLIFWVYIARRGGKWGSWHLEGQKLLAWLLIPTITVFFVLGLVMPGMREPEFLLLGWGTMFWWTWTR